MILVVDVCGTLVREDTTIGLLRWHLCRTSRWRYLILMALTARRSPLRLAAMVAERVTRRHIAKHLAVRLLQGQRNTDLDQSARDYARWLLSDRRLEPVFDLLQQNRYCSTIVLASASLEPVVRALAEELTVDYVASQLDSRAGRLSGRYAEDITGRKIDALEARLGPEWQSKGYIAISDNYSDRKLLEGAADAYVVLRRLRHRRRWHGLKARFLEAAR